MSCPALNEVTARDCADRFKQAREQFSPTAMFANGESRLLHPQRRETMNRYFEALEADELQSYTQISELSCDALRRYTHTHLRSFH